MPLLLLLSPAQTRRIMGSGDENAPKIDTSGRSRFLWLRVCVRSRFEVEIILALRALVLLVTWSVNDKLNE